MWSAQKSHGAKIPLQNTYPVNVKAVSCLIKYIINNSCGAGKIPSNNHETTQFILLKCKNLPKIPAKPKISSVVLFWSFLHKLE